MTYHPYIIGPPRLSCRGAHASHRSASLPIAPFFLPCVSQPQSLGPSGPVHRFRGACLLCKRCAMIPRGVWLSDLVRFFFNLPFAGRSNNPTKIVCKGEVYISTPLSDLEADFATSRQAQPARGFSANSKRCLECCHYRRR